MANKEYVGELSANADDDLAEELIENLKSNDNSCKFLDHTISTRNESLQKHAEKVYKDEYDGKLVSASYSEAEELRKAGNEVAYVQSEGLVKIIQQTNSYQEFSLGKKEVKTVSDYLEEFLDKYEGEMSLEMLDDFNELKSEIEDRL